MDGRIGTRVTSPLHAPRVGAAPTAPLRGPGMASDALALSARGPAGAVDPAAAQAARKAAEALWATPAEPGAGEGAGEGAWGAAAAGAQVAEDLVDVNDVRVGRGFGQAEASKLGKAAENIQWHWKLAGFGGADGAARAVAFIDAEAATFEASLAKLEQADPRQHARWSRAAAPILALQDGQTNATAITLFRKAQQTGDWGPLEDLARRCAHYGQARAREGAEGVRADLATKARQQLAANQPLERQALAAMAPADRAAYEQVRRALGDDAHSQLALQVMALEGRLGKPGGRDGATLAAALGGVAARPVAPGVDRRELLAALVRETATPTAITQRAGTWTCTVTSAQILVAIERPADYVRIVGELAAPAGRARLADGSAIHRVPGSEGPDLTGRTVSSRLWQAALMDFANGADRYDPKLDLSTRGDGTTYKGQVGFDSQKRLFDGATGRTGAVIGPQEAGGPAALLDQVKATLAAGHPVPATYIVREGVGHAIMITGAEAGHVTYADPMGLVKRVPEAEFAQKLFLARVDRAPT